MGLNENIAALPLPEPVKKSLLATCTALVDATKGELAALVLYGSAARGRYVEGSSDVNLLVLFEHAPASLLRTIGPVLRMGYRSIRIEPLLMTRAELLASTDVFPTKFKDLVATHVTLHGEPRLQELQFNREHLRLRVEQELRNLSLRFRRRFATHADSADELRGDIASTASAFASELRHLLDLAGMPVDQTASLEAVFAAGSSKFGGDAVALKAAATLHDRPKGRVEDIYAVAVGLLDALGRAADAANSMPEGK